MNRFSFYEKKIGAKLLYSKFIYPTTKDKIRFLKLITAALPDEKEPELAAFGLAAVYHQLPTTSLQITGKFSGRKGQSFDEEVRPRAHRVFVTASSHKVLPSLQILVNKILPFQRENKIAFPALSLQKERNWSLPECRPPNEVNYLFAKYPVNDPTYNLIVTLQFFFSTKSRNESCNESCNESLTENSFFPEKLFFEKRIEAIYYSRLFQLPLNLPYLVSHREVK